MSFPNRLPADSYEGTIDGISVQWRSNAIENLPDNADTFMVDAAALKGATEHLAHASAKRLGKETVRIMGSFHNSTTFAGSGEIRPQQTHCSLLVSPGNIKVHVYTNDFRGSIDSLQVLGEGVVKNKDKFPHRDLSTGTYTFPEP